MIKENEKPPYEMSREEWKKEMDLATPDGMPRYNSNGSGRTETIRKLERKAFLLYGVGKWIYEKAEKGEEWALDALEYNIYDTYQMILNKRAEECNDNQ